MKMNNDKKTKKSSLDDLKNNSHNNTNHQDNKSSHNQNHSKNNAEFENNKNKDNKNVNHNEHEKKQDNNQSTKVNELLVENAFLKKTLEQKNDKIKNLEDQINEFNKNYLNEITKKANEAKNKIDEKVKEMQTKFDNDVKHIKKYALKDKAIDLINIINNFELALSHSPSDPVVANYVQGFNMFLSMFNNYLESNNIKQINPKLGDDYDSKTMEAFEMTESKEYKTNQVIKVIKKGYKLHDIVIVPATVIVAK